MDRCANTEALNKFLREQEEAEDAMLSNCCEAEIIENTDLCSDCKENCVTKAEADEMAMYDNADSKMEEARESKCTT